MICLCSREPYSQNPVLVSALNVVKGQKTPMDLIRVETKSLVSILNKKSVYGSDPSARTQF